MSEVVLMQALSLLVEVAEHSDVDEERLVDGLSFTHADTHHALPYQQVHWNEFARYINRLDQELEGPMVELVVEKFMATNRYDSFMHIGGLVTGPKAYYWMANHVFAPLVFPVMTLEEEMVGARRMKVIATIAEHLEECPQYFEICGVLLGLGPTLMGMNAAQVRTQAAGHGATYVIDFPPSLSLFSQGRRMLDGALAGREFARELMEQNKVLAESYEEIKASEESFRILVDQSPDGVLICEEEEVIYANHCLATMLGWESADELIGHPLKALLEKPDHLQEAYSFGSHEVLTLWLKTRAGERLQVEARSVEARFMGRPAQVSLLRDMTLRNEILARAIDMDRLINMGTLTAGIAHEINNPLTIAQGNLIYVEEELQAAWDNSTDEDLKELLHALKASRLAVERAAEITREFKGAGSRVDEALEEVDLRDIVEAAIRLVRPELSKHARINLQLEQCGIALTNPPRLQQVILNLLLNATQAIPPDKKRKNKVAVRTFQQGRWSIIEVRDTGEGISEEHLRRIFEPFFTTKPVGEGTGLGLFISKDIIERLGGELDLTSELGEGTCAQVRIPLADDRILG